MAYELADIVARRRALNEEYELAKRALKEQFEPKLEVIDKYLQKYLIDNKLKTVATTAGTVLTYKRRNIKMVDLGELERWCTFNTKPEFIKQSVDSTEVLAYLDGDDKRQLPDGLRMDSTDVLSIKAPT